MTIDEWHHAIHYVKFDYVEDNHFAELKDSEVVRERLQTLDALVQHTGTYFSKDWVRKNILRLNEQEIADMKSSMDQESSDEQDFGPGGGSHPEAPWNQTEPEEQ